MYPENSFELVKEIFAIINYTIETKEDLFKLLISQKYLRSDEFKYKINKIIPKLKKQYNSHKLTCLHKNSLDKQKFPTINLIRQILKCNNLKLKPHVVCKGYYKSTNKKIFERYFVIK
jgi:hypothetical protein